MTAFRPNFRLLIAASALLLPQPLFAGGDIEYFLITDVIGGAIDVSDDGTRVLIGNGGPAWLWTEKDGSQPIGTASLGPMALSGDGSTVVGAQTIAGLQHAAVWTLAEGWQQPGPEIASCDASTGSAWCATDDGSVVFGLVWDACKAYPARWEAGALTIFDHLPNQSARPNAVSGDGSIVGGWQQTTMWTPCIWHADGTQILLAPATAGEVRGVSADGTYAVGQRNSKAFVWTEAGGLVQLPAVPGAFATILAEDVSSDGEVIVGWSGGFPSTPKACLWTPDTGGVDLKQYLVGQGVNVGATLLTHATAVTADGRTIVGVARVGTTNRAFVVRFPGPVCPADLDGNGTVDGGDAGLLLAEWGTRGSAADLDGSGVVDGGDFGVMLAAWGACAP